MANGKTLSYEDDFYPVHTHYFWWGAPTGWTDLELYDYNNNFVLDDNEIEDIVRDNIYDNPYITLSDTNNIDVKVKNGVVTLSGTVRNPRSKPLAYADAFWSSGVLDVENKIEVKRQHKREPEETGRSRSRQRQYA